MKGDRRLFTCPACQKSFFYWVPEAVTQPKVKCYFCSAEAFPNGEPPPPPAPAPAPPAQAAAPPAAAPATPAPQPAAAVPPAEGTPSPG